MTALYALVAWMSVHALAIALLRGSGTWANLFSSRHAVRRRRPDPLRSAPRGWIENHEFWAMSDVAPDEDADGDADEDAAFWGVPRRTAL